MSLNDFYLENTSKGYYDLITENGNFKTVYSFDTAIQMALFCERRADESEVLQPERRRGWFGNKILYKNGFENGSKLWLLMQTRLNTGTLSKAINWTKQALDYLVEDGYLKQVKVTGELGDYKSIRLFVDLVEFNNVVTRKHYDLWSNTAQRDLFNVVESVYDFLLFEDGTRVELEDESGELVI